MRQKTKFQIIILLIFISFNGKLSSSEIIEPQSNCETQYAQLQTTKANRVLDLSINSLTETPSYDKNGSDSFMILSKKGKKRQRVVHYQFEGYMVDNEGEHPIELEFDASNSGLTNIVYKNVTLGGKIRMKCTRFSGIIRMKDGFGGYSDYLDYFTIVGKDGPKDFIMSMTRIGNSPYEGTAWVGSKRLKVMLYLY